MNLGVLKLHGNEIKIGTSETDNEATKCNTTELTLIVERSLVNSNFRIISYFVWQEACISFIKILHTQM
jgi:hypothetical protein